MPLFLLRGCARLSLLHHSMISPGGIGIFSGRHFSLETWLGA